MRKNVAGQVICAQLLSSTTGAAVTSGTTTVYVLGDGGTQTEGAGTVTHKGSGCWSYAPTQAETNYNHVAFTFVNASALNATVQVYTISYDPHDTAGLGLSRLDAATSASSWTATLTESYAADGAAFTPAQALYMLWAITAEKSISGTTLTAKKLDGSTAAMAFTLDSATAPTSITRAS
jgi:hypothetical protein